MNENTIDKEKAKIIIVLLTCINIIIYAFFLLCFTDIDNDRPLKNGDVSADATVFQVQGEDIISDEAQEGLQDYEELIYSEYISKEDYSGQFNRSGTDRIAGILEGNSYYVNNTMVFNFGYGNLFSGFFDNSNVSAHGYSYEIAFLQDATVLNIYNNDATAVVMYYLYIDDRDNISLYYEAADITMDLKKL